MMTLAQSAAARYDRALHYARHTALPADQPIPQPTAAWPVENIALLESYQQWLVESGVSQYVVELIHIPMAGHVLGLTLKPHPQLALEADLNQALTYILAKKLSPHWTKNCRNSLIKFRQFLRQQRGLPDPPHFGPPLDVSRYEAGLPGWLVPHLHRYQRLQQAQWRQNRLGQKIKSFWRTHTAVLQWLCLHHPFTALQHIKRQQVLAYLDQRLEAGLAVSTINTELRAFQAVLRYLQEQDYLVPQALLRMSGLKQPDTLPRFLTDEQVMRLRDQLEARAEQAQTRPAQRDALLERATFYLMWQGGMRVGEVEDLLLADLDLKSQRLTVREGKGAKDRTVYLTQRATNALTAYLQMRGPGPSEHLFLYHSRSLSKDLLRDRLKATGERVGVSVSPHRLRHTFATQLINAGCRVTSLQQLLGHRRLNSTMRYARVHNRTVADDYYAAMTKIEQHLDLLPDEQAVPSDQILTLLEQLQVDPLTAQQQATLLNLRRAIFDLIEPVTHTLMMELLVSAP